MALAGQSRAYGPKVVAADILTGDKVINPKKEDLGTIEHLMIDLDSGRIAFAVLSFGGFWGIGNKLFAVPWDSFTVDTEEKRVLLNVDRSVLERAAGFDKNNWPDMANRGWGAGLSLLWQALRGLIAEEKSVALPAGQMVDKTQS